ncbi:metallophosphoesterase [Pseudomonas atacamensis]|uniref:metallophosphoesterase family protein n=1 Tax=Pseudomonas atacamensis TaxID=2565368 RepID=UPI00215EB37B|nr:metallophosphoesterase [Pseudomonas atacamensis]UVL13252.1 metallophosphoesterase [Pseudomonas atacamensis]
MKKISWLHLSDLHAGMDGQPRLWPSLKHSLFADLKNLHRTNGPWDFVVFSGDLTQKGSKEDYRNLSEVLKELWAIFQDLGFNPSLFCVPGNHDLVRPPKYQPEAMVLEEWWEKTGDFHSNFWKAESPFLKSTNNNFDNYTNWISTLPSLGINNIGTTTGIIAGDCAGTVTIDNIKIGVIGLNSAWLQLSNNKYIEKLHIDTNQALALTDNDLQSWCERNDFNLLVTHHPLDWLHKVSQKLFHEHINPDGRFTCHLFGHMHEPNHKTVSIGGGAAKREIQAASLFGLEHIQSEGIQRIHGYSLNRISVDAGTATLSFWPRKDRLIAGGRRVVGADPFFEFDEITTTLTSSNSSSPAITYAKPDLQVSKNISIEDFAEVSEGVLETYSMKIPPSPEHCDVRRLQSEQVVNALSTDRCCWLISEWGMGEDGFLWALQFKNNETMSRLFSIDMKSFRDLLSFQVSIQNETGYSIEELCGALETVTGAVLVLDDIPIDTSWAIAQTEELLKLVKIFLDFIPSLKIILRSRIVPSNALYTNIELKALDQGDTKYYILSHPNGGAKYCTYEAVDRIYRNTDGIPSVIDAILKNLYVTGLSGLSAISSDVAGKEVINTTGNEALRKTILAIGESPDPAIKRSYDLLKALTIFPQGEQLQRIKYFNNRVPFYPSSVFELMSRGLVHTVEIESLGTKSVDGENTIIVNRLARETVIDMMPPAQFKELNRKAAVLYFGEKVGQGGFKPPRSLRFDQPGRSNPEVSNAAVIIQRLAVDAASSADEKKINSLVSLISFHAKSLKTGSYFKASVDFFQDLLPIISECISDRQHAYLTNLYVSSLRMLDGDENTAQARDLILQIPAGALSKADQVTCELNLALCHHSLKSSEEAIKSAERVIKLDPRSNLSIQARWIILQNNEDDPALETKLNELEKTAIKRKTHVVIASIALDRAANTDDPIQQRAMYEKIITEANNNGDTYNSIRAIVALGEIRGITHSQLDKRRLISAYHYLYKGGFLHLFNMCHKALWSIFEKERDLTNLLQLFKYSSLVWRLRGKDKQERDAVKRLKSLTSGKSTEVSASSQTMAYYIFRSNSPD